jgi:hypothetical protein
MSKQKLQQGVIDEADDDFDPQEFKKSVESTSTRRVPKRLPEHVPPKAVAAPPQPTGAPKVAKQEPI